MIELETWGKINDDYRRSVRSIIEAAKQLNELIGDILENAKLRSRFDGLYPKSFSLSSAVTEAIEAVGDQAGRRKVLIETPAQGLRVIIYSDPRLVHYSLVRLLRSAIEESESPGKIDLVLKTCADGSVDIDVPFQPDAEGTSALGSLSPLSRFRVNLAEELATLIGATVSESRSGEHHTLTLRLPPHDRFPVTD